MKLRTIVAECQAKIEVLLDESQKVQFQATRHTS